MSHLLYLLSRCNVKICSCAILVFTAFNAGGQNCKAESTHTGIESEALTIVQKMASAYKSLTSFSCTLTTHGQGQGDLIVLGDSELQIAYKRPGKIFIRSVNKLTTTNIISDGVSIYCIRSNDKRHYLQEQCPHTGILTEAMRLADGQYIGSLLDGG